MRYNLGLIPLIFFAIPSCIVSLMIYPYTSWGGDTEYLRPGVAELSAAFAIASLVLLVLSAVMLFWEQETRRGTKAIIVGAVILFFAGIAIARLVWIGFYVLG